jgi:hypothetical protein
MTGASRSRFPAFRGGSVRASHSQGETHMQISEVHDIFVDVDHCRDPET